MQVELVLNGARVTAPVHGAGQTLLHWLRDAMGRTDVKDGCSKGDCGACAVLLEGQAVNACMVLALQAEGATVTTVQGLAVGERLHPIQEAFIAETAFQCSFCTPGILLATRALLAENPAPTEAEIKDYLAGNLCRCGSYLKIITAVQRAAEQLRTGDG